MWTVFLHLSNFRLDLGLRSVADFSNTMTRPLTSAERDPYFPRGERCSLNIQFDLASWLSFVSFFILSIDTILHHHHHIALVARISLTLSRHSSLSFIALGRSSGQHPVSSYSCWIYVRAGRPVFARPSNCCLFTDLFDPSRWQWRSSADYLLRLSIDPSLNSSALLHIHHTVSHGF